MGCYKGVSNIENTAICFKGTVCKNLFTSENFKIYALKVDDEKYPDIKLSEQYGNCIIKGNLHELRIGINYEVTANLIKDKYGYSYNVLNIRRERPNTSLDVQIFLQELLTPKQAETLYNAYPNIVDLVINNKTDEIDLNKTKGIKQATFEKIKTKIIDNFALAELVTEFKGSISFAMIKKLYETYPSVQKIKSEIKKDPYKCLCGISGIGFKTADSLLLDIQNNNIIDFEFNLKTSRQRCLSCILYLLDENEKEGNTNMNIVDLKHQVDKLTPECADYFVDCIKDDKIYFNKDILKVAKINTLKTEQFIADKIKQGLNLNLKWDCNVEEYRNKGEYVLTDEQLDSLNKVCNYNISLLQGYAGTGKTSTVQMLIQCLQDYNKTFKIFAPTGRAAKVISEYTNQPASTIHRGLGYKPPNDWFFNENNPIDVDIIIVDEFSMCDIWLCKHLFEAIDFSKTKLLLIGDSAQLPSVGCGNLLQDFISSDIIPMTTLTKIFRYGEGGLMTVATDVRNGKQYLQQDNNIQFFGNNRDYAFVPTQTENIIKNIIALYQKLLSQGYPPSDIQVLSSYNKGDCGSLKINNELQKVANSNYYSEEFIEVGKTKYYVDDIVIQKVNNYKARPYYRYDLFDLENDDYAKDSKVFIANGEMGVIKEVSQHYAVIDFNGVEVIYSKDELFDIGLGYSISIHKSQGGSAKVIILVTPQSHIYMLNSNLIYVGLTRMKEKCFHLGNIKTVNIAIKKKANLERNTFMKTLLKK